MRRGRYERRRREYNLQSAAATVGRKTPTSLGINGGAPLSFPRNPDRDLLASLHPLLPEWHAEKAVTLYRSSGPNWGRREDR
jgi:hypothetical protein